MSHLDIDALADLLAGRPDIDGHLPGCAECSARLAELRSAQTGVSAALAALAPTPMPADVAARIQAALRTADEAEATQPAEAPAILPAGPPDAALPADPHMGATVTTLPADLPGRREGQDRRRYLFAAAAAVVLLVGGLITIPQLRGGTSHSPIAATAGRPGSAGLGDLRRNNTGTNYGKDDVALKAALPALLRGDAPAGGLSRADSSARALPSQPRLNGQAGVKPVGDPLATLRQPIGLASCLAALLPPNDLRVLALDYASFQGSPALVVILPSSVAGKVDVFVVGATCAQADEKLLFFTRLSRPSR